MPSTIVRLDSVVHFVWTNGQLREQVGSDRPAKAGIKELGVQSTSGDAAWTTAKLRSHDIFLKTHHAAAHVSCVGSCLPADF